MENYFVIPDWPIPEGIQAVSTTRMGGVSQGPFATFNLADDLEEDPNHVKKNRTLLCQTLNLPTDPIWLTQVHGTKVKNLDDNQDLSLEYDASFTTQKDKVCVVLTADCLPVLFCDSKGTVIGAC
ncbi:MAG TPA: laccase domain-containing protein, partial [Gammaproteobacteria bacterium]|nr:laccase domain-containing protein [Gammaproteobacteria bacterium]